MKSDLPFLEYNSLNKDFARFLRKNATPAEQQMRELILRKWKSWFKFTRQKPISSFIVDFYCSQLKLAIEIDGSIHLEQEDYDAERSLVLEKLGIEVVRYRNDQVLNEIEEVEIDLSKKIAERAELFT